MKLTDQTTKNKTILFGNLLIRNLQKKRQYLVEKFNDQKTRKNVTIFRCKIQ